MPYRNKRTEIIRKNMKTVQSTELSSLPVIWFIRPITKSEKMAQFSEFYGKIFASWNHDPDFAPLKNTAFFLPSNVVKSVLNLKASIFTSFYSFRPLINLSRFQNEVGWDLRISMNWVWCENRRVKSWVRGCVENPAKCCAMEWKQKIGP